MANLASDALEGPGDTGPRAVEGRPDPSGDDGDGFSGGQGIGSDGLLDGVQASTIWASDRAVSVLWYMKVHRD